MPNSPRFRCMRVLRKASASRSMTHILRRNHHGKKTWKNIFINIKNYCKNGFIYQKNSYGFSSSFFFYAAWKKTKKRFLRVKEIFLLASFPKKPDFGKKKPKNHRITLLSQSLAGRKTSIPTATSPLHQHHHDCRGISFTTHPSREKWKSSQLIASSQSRANRRNDSGIVAPFLLHKTELFFRTTLRFFYWLQGYTAKE